MSMRAVVSSGSAVLVAATFATGVLAGAASEEIAPGVTVLAGAFVAGSQPDGNTVIFRAPDGMVVIDSGRHEAHTRAIVAHARDAGMSVRVLVNTHWHLDHVGGNPLLKREFPGLAVVASDAIRGAMAGFLADYREQLEGLVASATTPEAAQPFRDELAILDAGPELFPDAVVAASGARTLAGRRFEVHLEAHAVTAGDLWLHDPAARVVVAGDLVTLPAPFLDTACAPRWQEALGRLASVEFDVLVPGHGAPMDRATFARYRAAFDGFLACGASSQPAEACADGWVRDAGELLPEGDRKLARAMAAYYVENALRGPEERSAPLCGER